MEGVWADGEGRPLGLGPREETAKRKELLDGAEQFADGWTGQTYTASPEWKEQFMLCFIKMCIILLF